MYTLWRSFLSTMKIKAFGIYSTNKKDYNGLKYKHGYYWEKKYSVRKKAGLKQFKDYLHIFIYPVSPPCVIPLFYSFKCNSFSVRLSLFPVKCLPGCAGLRQGDRGNKMRWTIYIQLATWRGYCSSPFISSPRCGPQTSLNSCWGQNCWCNKLCGLPI